MNLLDGIMTTRAIRRYTDEAVDDADLATILFAATRAPTGSNRQPFRFIVLRDGPRAAVARELLARAAREMWGQKQAADGYADGSGTREDSPKARMARTMQHYTDNIASCPVIVLACLIRYRSPHPTEGASIYPACQNLLLAARELGLGGVLTGLHAFVDDELRAALAIPAAPAVALAATITLGHPQGAHGPVRRRPLRELVYEDGWEEPAPWAADPPGTRFTSAGPPAEAGASAGGPDNPRATP